MKLIVQTSILQRKPFHIYVKHYLKVHVSVAAAFHDPTELLKAAVERVTPEYSNAWITDCGYSK